MAKRLSDCGEAHRKLVSYLWQPASLVWQLPHIALGLQLLLQCSCSRNALSRQAGSRPCLKVEHMNIYGLPHAAAVARNKSID